MEYYKTHRVRKNAVKLLDVILTCNREKNPVTGNEEPTFIDMDAESRRKWEEANLEWIREAFRDPTSGRDNVLSATVHYDETSPHIHAIVMTEYNGRLNQTPYIGGRKQMYELQASYADKMLQSCGLKPRTKLSRATNKKIARFYTELNEIDPERNVERPRADETKEEVYMRCIEEMKDMSYAFFRESLEKKQEIAELKGKLADAIRDPENYRDKTIEQLEDRVKYMIVKNDKLFKALTKERKKAERDVELVHELGKIADQTGLNFGQDPGAQMTSILSKNDMESAQLIANIARMFDKLTAEREEIEAELQEIRERKKEEKRQKQMEESRETERARKKRNRNNPLLP